jgi:hypothetical protein
MRNREIFHCQLEPNACINAIEIPQWMFDPVICGAMRQQETPVLSSDALLQLSALLTHAAVVEESVVVQTQSHRLTTKGEADATHSRSTTDR